MKPEITLRPMTRSDLPFADSLRALAGWNQTLADWERLLSLSTTPGSGLVSEPGCFIAEWNGSPAGTVTTTSYGHQLAWIGMLLVHPDFRGRGIGRALLTRSLEYLRGRGIGCIKLDATPQGQPLYEQLGFQAEWPLTRWQIPRLGPAAFQISETIRPLEESDLHLVEHLDHDAFGVPRQSLLKSLLGGCHCARLLQTNDGLAGYGFLREGARAYYLGPLVAASPTSARLLVNALLANASGKPVYWDIPDPNVEATALAKSLGFTAQRPLLRMFLGENNSPGDTQRYFAIVEPAVG